MQNLVVVSHTVCTHVGSPKSLWEAVPRPLKSGLGVADPLETCFSTTCVTVPELVILGQST